jgi:hypothetical protein
MVAKNTVLVVAVSVLVVTAANPATDAKSTTDAQPMSLTSVEASVVAAITNLTSNSSQPHSSDKLLSSMEAAVEGLVMSGGKFEATPMGFSVKKIKRLLTHTMMPKVLAAHKADQRQLRKLIDEIKKCGSIKANAEKAAAPSLKKYKTSSRLHKSCRADEAIKFTSKKNCKSQEKSLLQIKNLKCNAFAAVSKKFGTSKNNAVVARKGGGESTLSYITRLSVTFCGVHGHGAKGTKSLPGGWGGGLPNGMLDKYLKAKDACETATKNYNDKIKECQRKAHAYNVKKAQCNQFQDMMDGGACKNAVVMKDGCESYAECYFSKVKIYKAFEKTVKYEKVDRKAEWRGLKRMICLIDSFGDGKVTAKEVDKCKKKSHSTKLLDIKYPRVPKLKKCTMAPLYPSTAAYKKAEFQSLPALAKGKASAECSGIKEVSLTPKKGSPKKCKCRRVVMNGVYSAGALVKCTKCLDVRRSTQTNSCPSGTKLFSPASRSDWKTFLSSATPLRRPHWIVDVTRPQNGCGGCTLYPMNSGNSRQKTWRTNDGSPWWLRSSRYNEPNGDYSANCYLDLWHRPKNENSVTYNDARCGYHSRSYYCQPEVLETRPNKGSPKSCKCRKIELTGSYSAGELVKCEQCITVKDATQKNSCPVGMKLFSPRSRSDWKTFLDSAGPLRAPNWIVDVTRPQNGCGGCTRFPMKSTTPQQATWKTADGSAWWLRSSRYNEPNGDYTANCYLDLWRTPNSQNNIQFNDGRCGYKSRSYYCQTVAKPKPKRKPAPPPISKAEGRARNYCDSLGWEVQWRSDNGALICSKPKRGGKYGNCDSCSTWRLVVWRAGASDQSPGGNQYLTKAGNFYCGHKPCKAGWNLPHGGLWDKKAGGGKLVFKKIWKKYPQNKPPGAYCPKGSVYHAHVCGRGAKRWKAKPRQRVRWGPHTGNEMMDNKRGAHCWTSCNCNYVKVACLSGAKFVDIKKRFPQNAYVGSFCPKGTIYFKHVCGTGANKWKGAEKVQYGPYSMNPYLAKGSAHCSRECNCNKIRIQCQAA